jgi:hypothetical protein
MPSGFYVQRTSDGRRVVVDVTPRDADGEPIVPPTLPEG